MTILNNLKIDGSRERPIMLDVFYNITGRPKPLIIFCHGFKGFKDWGHFNLIAKSFAEAGFVFCKFNFSYNGGTEEQVIDFPDLEAFGHNNISTELNDLGVLIDSWQKKNQFIPDTEVDRKNLTIIGHSRGGGVSILKAAEDARVKQLITLASIGQIGRLFDNVTFLENWKQTGVIYVPNGRTLQQMPMYYQYYEDYIEHQDRLDIAKAAASISIPWLIVHGDDDPVVLVKEAKKLHDLNGKSELFLVEKGDHTFGGKHPWTEDNLPNDAETIIDKAIAFLKS
ncbi:MAG: hypothetical protein R2730_16920 [Chitinophagales bacterium]